ncbi:MAG: T9SS type A sorting domain-containing protein [Flavobacteriaceae bacterium]
MLAPIVSFCQTLYGLKKTVNGSSTIPFDVVNINPFTGATTFVLSTNSLIAVAAGASTYDQQNSRYICWGIDNQNNENLYVMDLDNSQTESNLFSSVQAIEMEYDLRYQKAYGLWWDGAAEHFGEIDLSTGLVSSVSILPGVEAVAIGNSTFDSNSGNYIFIGQEANQYKLYTIDSETGTIINSPTIWQDGVTYSALEFNNQNGGKLYGLFRDINYDDYSPVYGTYFTDLRLAEIDLETGNSTIVDPQISVISGYLPGYAVGGLCFDQQTQTYIVRVQNETGNYLKLVSVYNSNIIASTEISNNNYFYELQVDNFSFAVDAYNLSATNFNPANDLNNLKIYPNPTSSYIYISYDDELEVILFDVLGKEINRGFYKNKVDVSYLDKGIYFLKILDGVNYSTHKIIKE